MLAVFDASDQKYLFTLWSNLTIEELKYSAHPPRFLCINLNTLLLPLHPSLLHIPLDLTHPLSGSLVPWSLHPLQAQPQEIFHIQPVQPRSCYRLDIPRTQVDPYPTGSCICIFAVSDPSVASSNFYLRSSSKTLLIVLTTSEYPPGQPSSVLFAISLLQAIRGWNPLVTPARAAPPEMAPAVGRRRLVDDLETA